MAVLINTQHELFCQAILTGKNQTEAAIEAGYKAKWARSIASRLSTKINIIERIKELNEAAASARIMSVIERKERLSEIARARLIDFVDTDEDGVHIAADSDSLNSAAIQSIQTRQRNMGFVIERITDIKLHDPVKAIAELNKMENLYSDGTTVNIDNRKVEINVVSPEAKKLTEAIVSGEGT